MTRTDPRRPITVRCPTCRGDSRFAPENPYRPFCSLRCREVDLGAWANEAYRVTEPDPPATEPPSPGDAH